ncbi:GlxA family transcriptional regulator [Mangrovibrevibacter kandeliae]|uniref:GlxA family transcriptional regulator n=1 Tax=Mangrovibrevibacter kandeliae TaxID=2968473 RepID=UPI0021184FBF|nr:MULTISPECIES: GlxA family transcriptional regulator [unclassified Aurantimonas]MCQ8780769.1 GlxA family transcriptional regulator [Aurantimonas sp. CSK15Z-1]MCW4113552.1 GlxA family transcriptional regulator [Aurantimonas sp. MSK8Z-1]
MTGIASVVTSSKPKAAERGPLRIGFLLAHNFTLSALSLFVDALRLAADEGDRSRPIRCTWSVMSARSEPIRASCGLMVNRTAPLGDPRDFHYIVVVGGLLHGGQAFDEVTLRYLRQAAAADVPLVGVCTGSFVLSRLGLMRGRRCCVSWFHLPDFQAEFHDVQADANQLFIVDRDRITCAGGSGVADLAAWLIERHIGADAAQKSLHVLQLQNARAGSEAQPHASSEHFRDERVRRAVLLMEQHMAEPLSVEAIAARLKLSSRQLERLFREATGKSPAIAYRLLRLRYAQRLLQTTQKSVTDIAVECGFCDGAHFARQFRAAFGVAPRKIRTADAIKEMAESLGASVNIEQVDAFV